MDDLDRRGDQLDRHVQQLTAAVEALGARMTRRGRWVVVVALIFAVLLAAVGIVAVRAERTAREQEVLRADVLCPVFALVVGGYDPSTRPSGPARERYTQTIEGVRRGYTTLGCTAPLVSPRVDR